MRNKIQLKARWDLGSRIDKGGFGTVYEATNGDGRRYVAKLIPKEPGADRELLFAAVTSNTNILPVIETGEADGNYVVIMPRADMSLLEHIGGRGGRLPWEEAVPVLRDIAAGLASLEVGVVHRDLKPGNILLYEGKWCIADFGISRYAESSTAPETHKFSLTPQYAAPEQWRLEHATKKADIYAFGITAYELLVGTLPFPGPGTPDFRKQHLTHNAPAITHCPDWLVGLVAECLMKAPESRPKASSLLERLQNQPAYASPALAKLQAVNSAVVQQNAKRSAEESANLLEANRREELARAAKQSLASIVDVLVQTVTAGSSLATVTRTPRLAVRLSKGELGVDVVSEAPQNCLTAYGYSCFDVIAFAEIGVRQPRRNDYDGRVHSLWYCDAMIEGEYRWYELAFMFTTLPMRSTITPFAFDPTTKEAADAFVPVTTGRALAWGMVPFDQGDQQQFIDRWINWFAGAAAGSLEYPTYLPEGEIHRPRSPRQLR